MTKATMGCIAQRLKSFINGIYKSFGMDMKPNRPARLLVFRVC